MEPRTAPEKARRARTEAGEALLYALVDWLPAGTNLVRMEDRIAAIEAEAAALALEDAARRIEGLDYRIVEWLNRPNGATYSLAAVVMWSAVLAVLRPVTEKEAGK